MLFRFVLFRGLMNNSEGIRAIALIHLSPALCPNGSEESALPLSPGASLRGYTAIDHLVPESPA